MALICSGYHIMALVILIYSTIMQSIIAKMQQHRDFIHRIIFSVKLRILAAILTLCAVVFAVIYAVSSMITQANTASAAHTYFATIYDVQQQKADGDKVLMAAYKKMNQPLYKILIGIEAVEYLCKTSKTQEAEQLLIEILKIDDIPSYITDALKLRLIGLQFTNNIKIETIMQNLRSFSVNSSIFLALFEETEMNIQMLSGDIKQCHGSIIKIYDKYQLPRDMRNRLEELRYITQFQ